MNPEKPIQIQPIKPVQAARMRRPLHRAYGLFSILFGVVLWTIAFTGVIQAAPSTQPYAIDRFDNNGQPGADIQQLGNESPIQSYGIPDPIALERQLIALINQMRWSQGLPAFKVNDALARAAHTQSQVLSKSRKVALVDADGNTPLQRAQNAGYAQPLTILELISAGYPKPEQVVAALRANSNASKNLFSPNVSELGVGYAYARDDRAYQHYWVINLGRRDGTSSLVMINNYLEPTTVNTPTTASVTPSETPAPTATPLTTAPATRTLVPFASPTATSKPATAITLHSMSSASNAAGATALAIDAPTGMTSGDVMIAHITVRGAYTAITAPSGWTLIRRDNTTFSIGVALYYKIVTGSEPTSFAWTFDSSQEASGGIVAYSGVDNTSPIDASSSQYNDATAIITVPSVTATASNSQLVFFAAVTTRASLIPPAGMAQRWLVSTAATTSGMADQALFSVGETGNRVGISGASRNSNIGQLVALKPATTVSSTPTSSPAITFTPIPTAVPSSTPTQMPTPIPTAVPSPTAQAGSVYWGAYILGNIVEDPHGPPKDAGTIDNFESHAGKKMSVMHWGQRWYRYGSYFNFDATLLEKVRQRGEINLLDWDSQDYGVSGHRYDQPTFSLGKIINGTHDAFIRQWATDAKNWGHPFFLRFNAEMNGDWEAWSELRNGNSPGQFVQAWRHVHDIFTQVGATNVTWVWCPNVEAKGTIPLEQLYPGDAYVDWTCMDGYNWGEHPAHAYGWKTFYDVFKPTYDHILRIAPTKPMMIAETSSTEVGKSKAAWITDMLTVQLPKNFPKIKALSWFNVNDYDVDWAIETSPAAQAAFAAGIASPYYAANGFADQNISPIPPPR